MNDFARFVSTFLNRRHQHLLGTAEGTSPTKKNAESFFTDLIDLALCGIGAEAASIFFLSPDSHELTIQYASGARVEDLSRICIKLGIGVVGHSAQKGETITTNDPAHDVRFNKGFDRLSQFTTRNLLAAPFFAGGKVAGVLELVNKIDGDFLSTEAESLTQALQAIQPLLEAALTAAP